MPVLTHSPRPQKHLKVDLRVPQGVAPADRLSICDLHYEILAHIFEQVVGDGSPCESDQGELVGLMVVCKQWRAVAVGTPRLWSNLAFDVLGQGAQEEDDIIRRCKLWLPRAKTLPLSVRIFIKGWGLPFWNERGLLTGDTRPPDPRELAEYLLGLSNLRSLQLFGHELVHFRCWFLQTSTSLSNLVIDVSKATASIPSPYGYDFPDYDEATIAGGDDVRLTRNSVIMNPADRFNKLTSLTLHAYVSSFFALSLLEESPSLATCNLDLHPKGYQTRLGLAQPQGTEVTWAKRRGQNVTLARLQDLELAHIAEQEETLQFLRTPRLRKLCVVDVRRSLLPLLHTCVEGSHGTLEELVLCGHIFSPQQSELPSPADSVDDRLVLEFLRVYPNTRSLTLNRLDLVNGSFLDNLQLLEYSPTLSHLRSLDISGNWKSFNIDSLLQFVRDRGRKSFVKRRTGEAVHGAEAFRRTLEWAHFQDWLHPELSVRYDAFHPSVKLVYSVDAYFDADED